MEAEKRKYVFFAVFNKNYTVSSAGTSNDNDNSGGGSGGSSGGSGGGSGDTSTVIG